MGYEQWAGRRTAKGNYLLLPGLKSFELASHKVRLALHSFKGVASFEAKQKKPESEFVELCREQLCRKDSRSAVSVRRVQKSDDLTQHTAVASDLWHQYIPVVVTT